MARRLPTFLAVLGLASALTVVTAPPTVAAPTQEQTVEIGSVPSGKNWWGRGSDYYDETIYTRSSSGLPVTLSVDAASAGVCAIGQIYPNPPSGSNPTGINFLGPGTCTLHADQAGNETYLPAPRATKSFFLDRVQPKLTVLRKTSGAGHQRTFRATLTAAGNPDVLVTFSVRGHPVCSGAPNGDRVATCTAALSQRDWFAYNFIASFAGDALYKPVSRKGPTFGE